MLGGMEEFRLWFARQVYLMFNSATDLSEEQFREKISALGLHLSVLQNKQLFSRYDKDNGGSVSLQEFMSRIMDPTSRIGNPSAQDRKLAREKRESEKIALKSPRNFILEKERTRQRLIRRLKKMQKPVECDHITDGILPLSAKAISDSENIRRATDSQTKHQWQHLAVPPKTKITAKGKWLHCKRPSPSPLARARKLINEKPVKAPTNAFALGGAIYAEGKGGGVVMGSRGGVSPRIANHISKNSKQRHICGIHIKPNNAIENVLSSLGFKAGK